MGLMGYDQQYQQTLQESLTLIIGREGSLKLI